MNGKDVLNNLIDEIERAKAIIQENRDVLEDNGVSMDYIDELLGDIEADTDRFYDHADSFEAVCEDIEIEAEKDDIPLEMD